MIHRKRRKRRKNRKVILDRTKVTFFSKKQSQKINSCKIVQNSTKFSRNFFSAKNISDQVQLSSDFKDTWSILVDNKSTPVNYMLLKKDFLNFSSFLFFQIGSIAQNKNPEMPEIFKPLKTLNSLCQALKYFS